MNANNPSIRAACEMMSAHPDRVFSKPELQDIMMKSGISRSSSTTYLNCFGNDVVVNGCKKVGQGQYQYVGTDVSKKIPLIKKAGWIDQICEMMMAHPDKKFSRAEILAMPTSLAESSRDTMLVNAFGGGKVNHGCCRISHGLYQYVGENAAPKPVNVTVLSNRRENIQVKSLALPAPDLEDIEQLRAKVVKLERMVLQMSSVFRTHFKMQKEVMDAISEMVGGD